MKITATLLAAAGLVDSAYGCGAHLLARAMQAQSPTDCVGGTAPPTTTFAIKNVRVFDGYAFGIPQAVLVSGTKIALVGGAAPPGIPTFDGTNKYLIPGLIDSHVHPQSCGALSNLTAYGVTTAVNMACLDYNACRALKDQVGVADYITAGLFAVGPNSLHAQFFQVPPELTLQPDADLGENVDYVFGNGSDFYKIVAEENGPTQQQQNTIVQLVHAKGKATYTHASYLAAYAQAIASKCDGIQHVPANGTLTSAQTAQIRSQGQFVTPTMEVFRVAFANPALGPLLGLTPADTYDNVVANVASLRQSKVPLAVGTDAVGSLPGILNFPFGLTLHCELQNLVGAGMGNAEVLRAATSGAAKLYKLPDRGAVKMGMRADLVLLNSNPLTDIAHTFDIKNVWVAGRQVTNVLSSKGTSCDPTTF
ncbi:amidohydrolase protein [Purpureocillium lavendulum]|uniref:Amidohydrolase protein n=1 Tax=Purpureocillium lavendulum TaxID=1247861 RepID=A0AB34FTV3_9HYPO|nr:amidohydrolase protein [Purpureocillium lavendulum]